MQLELAIDGRLVAHADRRGRGHLLVLHDHGYWSLLVVGHHTTDRMSDDDGGGTTAMTLERHSSIANLAKAVDRHGGPDAWHDLLDDNPELRGLLAQPRLLRLAHASPTGRRRVRAGRGR